jgi:hypothetical protein
MQRNWTADEDGQLLEMLRIDCHRTIIAKALDRTEMEIRARIGMLKALCESDVAVVRIASSEERCPPAAQSERNNHGPSGLFSS